MISSDEAQLVLKKWKTESTSISLMLSGKLYKGWLVGSITQLSENEAYISVRCTGELECLVVITLRGATFEYSDDREPAGFFSIRKRLKFSCFLEIKHEQSGERFVLAEIRESD